MLYYQRMRIAVILLSLGIMCGGAGCAKRPHTTITTSDNQLPTGIWRLEMDLGEAKLPFNFELEREEKNGSGYFYATIINGKEKIKTLPFHLTDSDSIYFKMPVFDCAFEGKRTGPGEFSGVWANYSKSKNYRIPFVARSGEAYRFAEGKSTLNVSGKWEVTFSKNTPDEYKAVGLFEQTGTKVTGTFLTETGDYRYLEGNVNGNEMNLSCFDGSHAFLFTSFKNESGDLIGTFYSGNHWKDNWVAVRNESFELTHPDSLTFMKDGFESISFSFPDLSGNTVSFPSEKYDGKVVIIQIMGSWCPNCMDETRLLTEFHKKYNARGLEVISLCFERSSDFNVASDNVKLHQSHLGASYDFLICGPASKESAAKALPMLNHVMSFPTSIFIDKKGKVRKIHTGFYGPGTGGYYYNFVDKTSSFIEKLLAE